MKQIVIKAKCQVRERWDRLGAKPGPDGSFATGNVPSKAPRFYLARFYPPLSENELKDCEERLQRTIPISYREFLSETNGLRVGKLSLQGFVFALKRDPSDDIGQPVSLDYGNIYGVSEMPAGYFCIGAINGEYYSQGQLHITSLGTVELRHRDTHQVGHTWTSFETFIEDEIGRQLELYDENGNTRADVRHLPGNTDDWERISKEIHLSRKRERSLSQKLLGRLFKRK